MVFGFGLVSDFQPRPCLPKLDMLEVLVTWVEWDVGCVDSGDRHTRRNRELLYHIFDILPCFIDLVAELFKEDVICISKSPVSKAYTI